MARLENWERRLNTAIEEATQTPFKWGRFDCVLWTASVVEAITGVNHASEFIGEYKTKREALALLKESHGTIQNALNDLFEPVAVLKAMRGDVVFYNKAIGVCNGANSFFATYDGLKPVATNLCTKAWRV